VGLVSWMSIVWAPFEIGIQFERVVTGIGKLTVSRIGGLRIGCIAFDFFG